MDAAQINPAEPVIFYALARVAYTNGDLSLADASYTRATQLREPQFTDDLSTGAAIRARSGAGLETEKYLQLLSQAGGKPPPMVTRAVSEGTAGLMTTPEPKMFQSISHC